MPSNFAAVERRTRFKSASEEMTMRLHLLKFALFFTTLALSAQAQSVPPTKPDVPSSAISLEATLHFLEDQLSANGTTHFVALSQHTAIGTTQNYTYTNAITNFHANPSTCSIDYHRKSTRDGQVEVDDDYGFNLKNVKNIVVQPLDQYMTETNARYRHPEDKVTSTTPAITAIIVYRNDSYEKSFYIADPILADRLAKALSHAVDLCGGQINKPL
jgi:hypothetical protein